MRCIESPPSFVAIERQTGESQILDAPRKDRVSSVMSPADRDRLTQILTVRLESLRLAGVLQLPRQAAIEPTDREVSKEDDVADSTTQAAAAAVHTVIASNIALPKVPPREPVAAQVVKEQEPVTARPAINKMAKKKSSWDPPTPTSLFEAPSAPVTAATKGLTLQILQQRVAGCTRCNELAATRTQTVFGVGNPKTRLCFLGEAPGADEDKQGEPFVGRGGQLLNKIIEACRLKREGIYILNMIKCRPPNNRNPLPHELANCREYLEGQLDLIRPEYICCLGAVASQNLLGTTVSIGKLRGKIHDYRGAKVVCTYHPAFLLRSPSFKKETWEDMKMLMREMGVVL